jgi:hypothetical protein
LEAYGGLAERPARKPGLSAASKSIEARRDLDSDELQQRGVVLEARPEGCPKQARPEVTFQPHRGVVGIRLVERVELRVVDRVLSYGPLALRASSVAVVSDTDMTATEHPQPRTGTRTAPDSGTDSGLAWQSCQSLARLTRRTHADSCPRAASGSASIGAESGPLRNRPVTVGTRPGGRRRQY